MNTELALLNGDGKLKLNEKKLRMLYFWSNNKYFAHCTMKDFDAKMLKHRLLPSLLILVTLGSITLVVVRLYGAQANQSLNENNARKSNMHDEDFFKKNAVYTLHVLDLLMLMIFVGDEQWAPVFFSVSPYRSEKTFLVDVLTRRKTGTFPTCVLVLRLSPSLQFFKSCWKFPFTFFSAQKQKRKSLSPSRPLPC